MVCLISKMHLGLVQYCAKITMSVKNFFNINSTIKAGSGLSEHGNKTDAIHSRLHYLSNEIFYVQGQSCKPAHCDAQTYNSEWNSVNMPTAVSHSVINGKYN